MAVSLTVRDIDSARNGLFSPLRPMFDAPLRATRQNFWMKLIPQKLEVCDYCTVKIARL